MRPIVKAVGLICILAHDYVYAAHTTTAARPFFPPLPLTAHGNCPAKSEPACHHLRQAPGFNDIDQLSGYSMLFSLSISLSNVYQHLYFILLFAKKPVLQHFQCFNFAFLYLLFPTIL
jgi:hypothetical protein